MINNFTFTKEVSMFDKELIAKLLGKFDEIYKETSYKSNFDHIRHLRKNDILEEPLFLSLHNKIKKKIQLLTGFNDLSFEKLWLVTSSSNVTNKAALPYIPHIDKSRYLKAMVYLHDVSLKHGPIHLGQVKNTINIELRRKDLPQDYKDKGLNTITDEHLEGNLIPMVGKAGDVIFFDTNTPHKAGIIKGSYCRKVLRFDFERPFFNPKPSILDRLINKLK